MTKLNKMEVAIFSVNQPGMSKRDEAYVYLEMCDILKERGVPHQLARGMWMGEDECSFVVPSSLINSLPLREMGQTHYLLVDRNGMGVLVDVESKENPLEVGRVKSSLVKPEGDWTKVDNVYYQFGGS